MKKILELLEAKKATKPQAGGTWLPRTPPSGMDHQGPDPTKRYQPFSRTGVPPGSKPGKSTSRAKKTVKEAALRMLEAKKSSSGMDYVGPYDAGVSPYGPSTPKAKRKPSSSSGMDYVGPYGAGVSPYGPPAKPVKPKPKLSKNYQGPYGTGASQWD